MSEVKPLSGVEESRLRKRDDLSEDCRRLIATLAHGRDVLQRMLVDSADKLEAAEARLAEVERERDEALQNWRFQAEEARQMYPEVRELRAKLAAAEAWAERLEAVVGAARAFDIENDPYAYNYSVLKQAVLAVDAAAPPEPAKAREDRLRSLGYEPVEPSDVPGMVRGAPEPARGEGEEGT